ncbi:MAG TPA: Ig-like domain-containing protein [Gaiellaceae bacterium]|nr:Ig-like domain-containing protein [Gaiellaceae bacterium]
MPLPFARLRPLAVLPVIALATVVLQTAGATTSVVSADRVGLNTHLVWVSQADARAVLAEARAGGVEWVREEFPWGSVEPQRGTFTWGRTDALMAAASQAHVNVLGILAYSAPWASSDPSGNGDSKYPPRDAADYARYAAAVVGRYGPGGSFWASRPDLRPRPLTAVELWNEPFGYWFWKPNPDPARYARLVRAAVAAIRSTAPGVEILVAGDVLQVRTDGQIVDWLRNLRAADPGLNTLVDAYSVHPYPHPRTNGPYADRIDPRWDYRRVSLTRRIDPSLPVWITEVGWSTASTSDSVSETTQASHVRGAVTRALVEWGSYVERIFVYSFDRDSGNAVDREGYYGLRRRDGSAKPAWTELKTLLAGERSISSAPTPPPSFSVSIPGLVEGQTVRGAIVWQAQPAGATVDRVVFSIDGTARRTELVAPYRYNGDTGTLDTRSLGAGSHTLTVTAAAVDGRIARATVTVTVKRAKARKLANRRPALRVGRHQFR